MLPDPNVLTTSTAHGPCEPGTFAELLIDCEEDRTLRAVLVRMLREIERESN